MLNTLRNWYEQRHLNRHHRHFCDGYGWAWSATQVEGMSAGMLYAHILHTLPNDSVRQLHFDAGARQAFDDIEFYNAVKGQSHDPAS